MELFFRTSEKSDLQQQLDWDLQASTDVPAVDEPVVVEPHPADPRPLFGNAKKQGFDVDLWGGWVKP